MIEQLLYYQFGFFAPNTHLEPEPDIVGRFLEAFKDKGFIPTTIQEFQVSPAPSMRLQLQFTSPKGEWNVAFEPNRVLLKKLASETETDIGSPEDFAKKADEIFRSLLGVQQFVGTRLSYATKGWLPDMPDSKLIELNKRVFNLVPFYMKYPPHEWAARNVAKYDVELGDKTEALNVITNINRRQGTLTKGTESSSFDKIEIAFDINTYQGNTDLRFDADDVELFLNVANEKSQEIMTEIEGKLNG